MNNTIKAKIEIKCLQALMLLGDYVCEFFYFVLKLNINSPQYLYRLYRCTVHFVETFN